MQVMKKPSVCLVKVAPRCIRVISTHLIAVACKQTTCFEMKIPESISGTCTTPGLQSLSQSKYCALDFIYAEPLLN